MKFIIAMLMLLPTIGCAQNAKNSIEDHCELTGFIDELKYNLMKKCDSDIVVIDSNGGYVSQAQRISEVLKGKTLICVNCSSAAAFIFAKHKGPRYVINSYIMMFHKSYYMRESFEPGEKIDSDLLRHMADALDRSHIINSKGFVGISSEEYLRKVEFGDWYPTLEEVDKYKLADGTVDASK